MNSRAITSALAVIATLFAPVRADVHAARQAVANRDFAAAFSNYLELAKLGLVEAQENVAIAYVNGEGVARDNVLGFAWAEIAQENGSTRVQNIVDEIKPHVTPVAQKRIDAVFAESGPSALGARLLPILRTPATPPHICAFSEVANPDDFYPRGAREHSLGGTVFVDFTVQPDGHAHTAHVLHATTPILFDEAARSFIMHSTFRVRRANGVGVPCNMRMNVTFHISGQTSTMPVELKGRLPTPREIAPVGGQGSTFCSTLIKHPKPDAETGSFIPMAVVAAQSGDAGAQYFVGVYTRYGVAVEKDSSKAAAWLALAAKAGHPQAQVALADLYLSSPLTSQASTQEAIQQLESAVRSGYYAAAYRLAAILATSPDGRVRDTTRAIELIEGVMPALGIDPVPYEIHAAALAWIGEFDDAVADEKFALECAYRLGWDKSPLNARLALYKERKTWVGNLMPD